MGGVDVLRTTYFNGFIGFFKLGVDALRTRYFSGFIGF